MWRSLVLLALLASVQGRAVNISNTWVLPEEGFPVFYRYFRDRISWYEADAVCQFHHANLVTVDTTAQYDAVRAYLRELDISSAVWVGLIRSNPDGDFTWTDYRGLSGDGYWSSAPDTRSAPLCAAANPAADYRWEARACGGPTVASFICELPVPQWALGNEGCMVRELPALTILYLPESAAVQLNADCGLAGVKRVQCTGYVKREGLLKDLSCADDEEIFSTSTDTNWAATADSSADQDTSSDTTTEENTTVEHENDMNQPVVITATSIPQYINSKTQYKSSTKLSDMNNFNKVSFSKDIKLGTSDDHNIQSNFIPKQVDDGNDLVDEQLQKLEDERHMQHKMLHEEIARVGNVDNIFTQPADHFIPPLVMAKSRMSDDMTVLSLAEKHAQQIAEKQFSKHSQDDHSLVVETSNLPSENKHNIDKLLIASVKPNQVKESKPNFLKTHVPKKYVNEKYYESKEKGAKMWQSKPSEIHKPSDLIQIPINTLDDGKAIALKNHSQYQDKIDEDFAMDLKVMLKDAPPTSVKNTASARYTGDVAMLETITNKNILVNNKLGNPKTSHENSSPLPNIETVDNNSMDHEVIQITVISNDDPAVNTTSFEMTTKMPIFRDDTEKSGIDFTSLSPIVSMETHITESIEVEEPESTSKANQEKLPATVRASLSITNITEEEPITINDATLYISTTAENITTQTETITTVTTMPLIINKTDITEIPTTLTTTAFFNSTNEVTTDVIDKITIVNSTNNLQTNVSSEKLDFNNTEVHDLLGTNMTDTEEIIDDDSPLLSGVYEPEQRPPRTRRPQQQNRKFNPFRILG